MAYNNTYDFQAITETEYISAKANVTTCLDLIQKCRIVADIYDPENMGINSTVNSVCSAAYEWCYLNVEAAYLASGASLSSRIVTTLLMNQSVRCIQYRPHNSQPDPLQVRDRLPKSTLGTICSRRALELHLPEYGRLQQRHGNR
jgi:hypothetical protein